MGESASLLSCLLSCRLHEAYSKNGLGLELNSSSSLARYCNFYHDDFTRNTCHSKCYSYSILGHLTNCCRHSEYRWLNWLRDFWALYMKYCLAKSMARGETYATYAFDNEIQVKTKNLPHFLASILPLLLLIIIALTGSLFGNDFFKKNIIFIALLAAILTASWLFRQFIPNKIAVFNLGASSSIAPIFATASAVAFGAVVMIAPGFTFFSDLILNIPGNPLISLAVLTSSMSAITGSSSGALGIVMPNFAQYYLDQGLNPEMIHRVATIASNIFTIVPQSGVFLTFLALTGLNHKNAFKETFITVSVSTFIAQVIVIAFDLFS